MIASPTFEALAADQHFDSQIALLREHWCSVRRLWLDSADCRAGATLRSSLPRDFWIGAGMPGLASIRPIRGGRFDFAEDGLTALIVPCYDGLPCLLDANPERHVEELRDLVAVDVDHPDRYWRRRGDALVLGSAYLDIAGYEGVPVPLFQNPITWLLAGGAGIAILDWSWVPELLLGHELIAEDLGLGERLDAALKPNIWIGRAAA